MVKKKKKGGRGKKETAPSVRTQLAAGSAASLARRLHGFLVHGDVGRTSLAVVCPY